MVEVLIDDFSNCYTDIEQLFLTVQNRMENNEYISKALKEIEQAEYFSNRYFTDRFGGNLYWDCLSTGCKAAICAYFYKDKYISLIECGDNAIKFILENNVDGKYVLYNRYYRIGSDVNKEIKYKNFIFDSVSSLIYYIMNEHPYLPTVGGYYV